MGRKTDTKQKMIAAAKQGFRTKGFAATGFSEVLASSGAARGAIYHHFPGGKEELAVAVAQSNEANVSDFLSASLAEMNSVAEATQWLINFWAKALDAKQPLPFGCPIAPLVLENPQSAPILAAATSAFDSWQGVISEFCQAKNWPAQTAEDFAALVVATFEGGLVMCRAADSAQALRRIERILTTAVTLIEADSKH